MFDTPEVPVAQRVARPWGEGVQVNPNAQDAQ